MINAVNARFVSVFMPDRTYRIHVDRGEIFAIRIGGQGGLAEAVALHFGLLGFLAMKPLKARGEAKLAARAADVDQKHPSTQLSAHKHNFHTTAGALSASSLEPAAAIRAHGEHAGRWRLKFRDGKEMTFQLEMFEEMRTAYQILPSLGSVHVNQVVYDALSKQFKKAPAAEMAGVGS